MEHARSLAPFRRCSMTTRLYIAGPMSGHENYNYPAFHAAAEALRKAGYQVENPAENEAPNAAPSWSDWMRVALRQMLTCDAVALLDGWEESAGACMEHEVATRLRMSARPAGKWVAMRQGGAS